MPAKSPDGWHKLGKVSPPLNEHYPPTRLPTSLRVYSPPRTCSAEMNFSLRLKNLPQVFPQFKKPEPLRDPLSSRLRSTSQADYVRYCFPKRKYHHLKTNKLKEQDGSLSLKTDFNLFEVWVIMSTSAVGSENTRCLHLNFNVPHPSSKCS